MRPRPVSFCPLAEGEHLPLSLLKGRELQSEKGTARTIRRCLCLPAGASKIACDPEQCAVNLARALVWSATTDDPRRALGGAAKKLYRDYAQARAAQTHYLSKEAQALVDELLDFDP